jgi:hypothetical protein
MDLNVNQLNLTAVSGAAAVRNSKMLCYNILNKKNSAYTDWDVLVGINVLVTHESFYVFL